MAKEMETPKDEGLQGNETIEEAILGLQKEPTPELLAHVLTVIRRRMKEGGQAILSVEPPSGDDQIRIGTVKSADGKVWSIQLQTTLHCFCALSHLMRN